MIISTICTRGLSGNELRLRLRFFVVYVCFVPVSSLFVVVICMGLSKMLSFMSFIHFNIPSKVV